MLLRTLQTAMCILAFAWMLLCFAPQGMRVCIQSSGEIHTGLSCQCDTCQEPDLSAMCQDGCCNSTGDAQQVEDRCCICMQLLIASVIPSINPQLTQPIAVDCTSSPVDVFFAQQSGMIQVARQTPMRPPPLLRTTVLRI